MKRFSFLLTFGLAVMAAGAVLAGSDDDAATLTEISGYQQWTRVNAKPVEVPVPITLTRGTFDISSIAA